MSRHVKHGESTSTRGRSHLTETYGILINFSVIQMHNIKIPFFSRFTRKRLHIRKGAEASLNALPTVPVNRRYRPAADSRPSNERATAKRPFDMVCIFFFFFPFFFPLPRMLISILYTHTLFIFIYLKANRFQVTVSLVVVVHLIKTKRHSL